MKRFNNKASGEVQVTGGNLYGQKHEHRQQVENVVDRRSGEGSRAKSSSRLKAPLSRPHDTGRVRHQAGERSVSCATLGGALWFK